MRKRLKDQTPEERFWNKVNIPDNEDDCWTWMGGVSGNYGRFFSEGLAESLVHRVSYSLAYGDIPKDMCVLHKCNNQLCVNPKHLELKLRVDVSGNPRSKLKKDTSLEERFWQKVSIPDDSSKCWNWMGGTTRRGYGVFSPCNKLVNETRAHRISYTLANGPISDGLFVCHSCDNPACVNPDHLWLGTNRDNMRDMIRKGRGRNGGGSKKIVLGPRCFIRDHRRKKKCYGPWSRMNKVTKGPSSYLKSRTIHYPPHCEDMEYLLTPFWE